MFKFTHAHNVSEQAEKRLQRRSLSVSSLAGSLVRVVSIALVILLFVPLEALAQAPLTILGPARPVSHREAALLVRVPVALGDTSLLVVSNDPAHPFAHPVDSPISVRDSGGSVYVYVIDNTINGPLERQHAELLSEALTQQVNEGNRVGIRIVDHSERLGAASLQPTRDSAALRSFLTQNLDGDGTRSPIYTVVERALDDLASVVRDADHYEVVLVSDGRSEDFGGSDDAADELNETIEQISRKAVAAGIPVSIFAIDREPVRQQTQLQHLTRMQQLASSTGGIYQPDSFANAAEYLAGHRELSTQLGRTVVVPYPCLSGSPTSPTSQFAVAEATAEGTAVVGGALSPTSQVASTFVFCSSVAALYSALSGSEPEDADSGSGEDRDSAEGESDEDANEASGEDADASARGADRDSGFERFINALTDGGPAVWMMGVAILGLLVAALVFWLTGRQAPATEAPTDPNTAAPPPETLLAPQTVPDLATSHTVVDHQPAGSTALGEQREAVLYRPAPTPLRLHALRSLWSQQAGFCVVFANGRTLQEMMVPVAGIYVGRNPTGTIEVTPTRTGNSQLRFRAADNVSIWAEPLSSPVLRDGAEPLATPSQVPPGSFFDLSNDTIVELRMLVLGGRHEFGDGNRAEQWRLVRIANDLYLTESLAVQAISTVVGRAPVAGNSEIGIALASTPDSPAARLVSATHARVWTSGGIPFVYDQSSNGTFVNGERIAARAARALRQNDEIGFGREAVYRVTRIA
jgi:hypothetical protein